MIRDISLEYSKYQSNMFPISNLQNIQNFNFQNMQPLINLININGNPLKYKPHENSKKKENIFLNKKRFKIETNSKEFTKKQAIKNKKVVFCHSDKIINPRVKKEKNIQPPDIHLLPNTTSKSKSNQSDDSFITNSPKCKNRGSIYRGVSRNGHQWQVLIMINKKKLYIGSYSAEKQAAKAYDVVALRYHGKKAKTNFYYSQEEIEEII